MREKDVDCLGLVSWSAQPPLGLLCGAYYHAETVFDSAHPEVPGHTGALQVVVENGAFALVEYNERCSPGYYMRRFQGVDKRLSDYPFFQAGKERTAKTGVVLVNGGFVNGHAATGADQVVQLVDGSDQAGLGRGGERAERALRQVERLDVGADGLGQGDEALFKSHGGSFQALARM